MQNASNKQRRRRRSSCGRRPRQSYQGYMGQGHTGQLGHGLPLEERLYSQIYGPYTDRILTLLGHGLPLEEETLPRLIHSLWDVQIVQVARGTTASVSIRIDPY